MQLLMISLILVVLSFFGTFLIRKIALRKSFLDYPTERSSHTKPTPKGGGLAIVVFLYLGLIYLFINENIDRNLFYCLLCGLPIAIISLLDDLRGLSPKLRLAVQGISTAGGLIFLNGFEYIDLSFFILDNKWILSIIAFIGIIWYINLFNFIDGIDGYASVETLYMAIVMLLFLGNPIFLVIISVIIGFLFWNWPRAKIFMGDVGSTTLGYILVMLGIYFNNLHEFPFISWMMLSSLFWFDATLTIYRRFKNKEILSNAHNNHAYQRIVKAGFSHQKTILYSILINLFILGLVWLAKIFQNMGLIFFLINIVGLYIIVKLIDKKEPFPYTKK